MAIIIRTLCWALIFIIRLRLPPGSSLAIKQYENRTMSHVIENRTMSLRSKI